MCKVSLNWNGDSESGEEGMIEEQVQRRFENAYNFLKVVIIVPWLVWLSWLECSRSWRLWAWFPVRAHTWVVGLIPLSRCIWSPVWVRGIPGLGTYGRQLIGASLSNRCFYLSLLPSLKAVMKMCLWVRIIFKNCNCCTNIIVIVI